MTVSATEEGQTEEDATQVIEYLVLREKLDCINGVWMTGLEIDLILKNTYSMPQVTLQEQLKRQKRMGERTTKFTMEMIWAVARAGEGNCE